MIKGKLLKCPVCSKPATWEGNPFRPFCSERCKLIDLGSWASGKYRIPGPPLEKEDMEEEESGSNTEKEKP